MANLPDRLEFNTVFHCPYLQRDLPVHECNSLYVEANAFQRSRLARTGVPEEAMTEDDEVEGRVGLALRLQRSGQVSPCRGCRLGEEVRYRYGCEGVEDEE